MPERCGRVSIPGDPEAIEAAARGLDRDADSAGEEILGDVRLARDAALADWSAPSAQEFGAYVSRALSFETEMVAAERAAVQIWHTYAEELRAAQSALEQAIENEQSAERAGDRAEDDSPADAKAENAARDAREDQLAAGRDAAAAAERAAGAMERVIDALPEVPGSAGRGADGGGFDFALDSPSPTIPLDGLYGGAKSFQEWQNLRSDRLRDNRRLAGYARAAGYGVATASDEINTAAHDSANRRVLQARSTARTISRFAKPLGPVGLVADFGGNMVQGRGATESLGRTAVSGAAVAGTVALTAGACGALTAGLAAAACGVAAAGVGSYIGSEAGDLIFGED